ncbi:MAG: DUF2530 domain-containing protein [Actinobacteria bacterium]|nr:DUF2530 domain-containing protein [Actinomycetota bacterium]MBI3688460.1 DUF2530 domain-containing protein [Actinomycetota bacterium]
MPRRHPTPEPLQVNAVRVVLIGTVAWFLAFGVLVALLLVRGPAAEAGHRSWLWTSLAGWTLGLLGIFMAARARHRG